MYYKNIFKTQSPNKQYISSILCFLAKRLFEHIFHFINLIKKCNGVLNVIFSAYFNSFEIPNNTNATENMMILSENRQCDVMSCRGKSKIC